MSRGIPPDAAELITDAPVVAHLATCTEGRPHVAPVWYGYRADEERGGYLEILTTGRKLADIRENPYVAVSIQRDHEGDAEWMVSLRGTAEIVADDAETRAAAKRINPKYGAEPSAWPENTLVRIDVGSATHRTY